MTAGQPKKSEVLEVRLPYEAKTAFMARCRQSGRTASEVVRLFIDQELEGRKAKPRLMWRAVAAALAGLAVGAVAAPSLARPTASQTVFDRLDANRDGVLSFEEFRRR